MADINIQEVTNHINIETANGYNLEFNGPVVNMNVVLSNYYTKTETDALLNDKADKADTYTISQIDGMVQDINTAVDTKQNLITGAASTITNSNLTANRAVISNASGKVAVSNVTSTELGYLSGVTSGVQTQLNNKASTSLDNLSATGQMIIDSQNGTISNCILEMPQNIKLTLENNVLTLKAGSIITLTGSTYATYTLTAAQTYTVSSSLTDGKYYLFTNSAGVIQAPIATTDVVSATSLPASGTYCYLTTDRIIYKYEDSEWNATTLAYPLGIIEMSGGVASFAKDSNGNDMIFNGACFVGHHAIIYPNVKGLRADGITDEGNLNSYLINYNGLIIFEMSGTAPSGYRRCLYSSVSTGVAQMSYREITDISELDGTSYYSYVKNSNSVMKGDGTVVNRFVWVYFALSDTTVTDFTIRQPVRTATVEMLNNTLGDIETLLAAI